MKKFLKFLKRKSKEVIKSIFYKFLELIVLTVIILITGLPGIIIGYLILELKDLNSIATCGFISFALTIMISFIIVKVKDILKEYHSFNDDDDEDDKEYDDFL